MEGVAPHQGLSERLAGVRERIARAGAGGRAITIVAVTKGFGADAVRAARDAGLTDFGENYAQSLIDKAELDVAGAAWHFIGGIQRRKVAKLAPHVHLWQSVARSEEGAEIARRSPGAAVLVQVNLSGRPQRNGCSWKDATALVDSLQLQGLEVRGLMGMAPPELGPESGRAEFRRLAEMAAELSLPEVSMGMSDDYEMAVAEGSTMVRLGTALFGPRPETANLRR